MSKEPLDNVALKDRATALLVKAKKAGKGDVMKKFVETKTLRVKLTTEEIVQAGDDLADVIGDAVALEDELEGLKKHFKGRLTEIENKITQQRTKVHDKWEYRKVDCVEIKNNTTGQVVSIRMDTDEIIDERKMTADERQGHLWDEDDEESE